MANYPAVRDPNRAPTHPGAALADILRDLPHTKAEIATLIGVSRGHLNDILNEKRRVSPEMAARLGRLFGDGPGIWLHMQADYDTWRVLHEEPKGN